MVGSPAALSFAAVSATHDVLGPPEIIGDPAGVATRETANHLHGTTRRSGKMAVRVGNISAHEDIHTRRDSTLNLVVALSPVGIANDDGFWQSLGLHGTYVRTCVRALRAYVRTYVRTYTAT